MQFLDGCKHTQRAKKYTHKVLLWKVIIRKMCLSLKLPIDLIREIILFAWKIPWMEEPDRLQSMGSLRVGYD